MRFVLGVGALLAGGQPVERGLGEEQVPVAHYLRHFLEEEGHQQGRDVCPVDVGVGHDDHAVVAQVLRVAILPHTAT